MHFTFGHFYAIMSLYNTPNCVPPAAQMQQKCGFNPLYLSLKQLVHAIIKIKQRLSHFNLMPFLSNKKRRGVSRVGGPSACQLSSGHRPIASIASWPCFYLSGHPGRILKRERKRVLKAKAHGTAATCRSHWFDGASHYLYIEPALVKNCQIGIRGLSSFESD